MISQKLRSIMESILPVLMFLQKNILPFWKSLLVIMVPILLSPIAFSGGTSKESRCGYVILVMAVFWMVDALPLAVTALIPVFAFPLLGVLSTSEVSSAYVNQTSMLFIGGLMVATAVEFSNLHKRVALFVILHIGQSPRRLMAGFMLTTMFLSMWISNTASTAMMIPIVQAVVDEIVKEPNEENINLEERPSGGVENPAFSIDNENSPKSADDSKDTEANNDVSIPSTTSPEGTQSLGKLLRTMFFLSVAYSANIGGTGTLTGTAPNLVTKAELDKSFSEPTGLEFGSWMAFNIPGVLCCCLFAWFWLQFQFIGIGSKSKLPRLTEEHKKRLNTTLRNKYNELGRISFHEAVVMVLFIIMVAAWLFRSPGFIPGWATWFDFGNNVAIKDATSAMLTVVLLFAFPARPNFWPFRTKSDISKGPPSPSEGCLTWDVVHRNVSWNVIILIGGGFAMASAAGKSGLSTAVGEQFRVIGVLPGPVLVFAVTLMTTMITEVASNTATASILMPILKELSLKICINPLYLMLPTAVCTSYAFMLPVATAPNALVYEAAKIQTVDMMKAGFAMNIGCVIIINIIINTLGVAMFDIHNMPSWVNSTTTPGDVMQCFSSLEA